MPGIQGIGGVFVKEKIIEQKFRAAVRTAGGVAVKFVSPGLDGMPDRLALLLYGMVAENHNDYWGNIISGVELVSLSQEHGVMHCTDDFLDRLHVGDVVTVLPVHSCMTADLMKIYHMNDGKTAAHI